MTGREGKDGEDVGSVSEEAAKLLHALQDWAKESGTEYAGATAAAAEGAARRRTGSTSTSPPAAASAPTARSAGSSRRSGTPAPR